MSKKDNIENPKQVEFTLQDNEVYITEIPGDFYERQKYTPPNEKEVQAQIPGTIYKVLVKEGQSVNEGDELLVLEAMKMRNKVLSALSGTIKSIHVKVGDIVRKNAILITYQ